MYDFTGFKEHILSSQKILLFPHMNIDGDATGCCVALALGLRSLGKECFAIVNEDIPDNLFFLEGENDIFRREAPYKAELAIAVDCGLTSRFEKKKHYFEEAEKTLCFDHHIKDERIADFEVVDSSAAACSMLVFQFLEYMHIAVSSEIASALYVALMTDTACLKYSNADIDAVLFLEKLYSFDIDHALLCAKVFECYPLTQLKLDALTVSRMEVFAGGKAAISSITQEILVSMKASDYMTETSINRIRSVGGVEIACFLREMRDGSIKASLRAKTEANVNRIASKFGGGGHIKASGCTLRLGMDEAMAVMKKAIEEELSLLI